jgi:hypothetical protein
VAAAVGGAISYILKKMQNSKIGNLRDRGNSDRFGLNERGN